MKKYSLFLLTTACLLGASLVPASSFAQKSNKDSIQVAKIKALIDSQHYTFKARSVTPQGARMRQLTSNYDLQVSKDVIISQLPYFGRAYSAPVGSSDNGFDFTAKDFEYKIVPKKKTGWDVTIKFKDAKDVTTMNLSIFDNGSSSLSVISNSRQFISYDGDIIEPAKKK